MKIPATPPDMASVLSLMESHLFGRAAQQKWGPAPGGQYRHWDTVRRIDPPIGFTVQQFWAFLKLYRQSSVKKLEFLWDNDNVAFCHTMPDPLIQMLRTVDQLSFGSPDNSRPAILAGAVSRFALTSLVEESITSSQLEGAATTTKVAKELLRSGRKPISDGEKMIWNNYQAMQQLLHLKNAPLSIEMIDNIHGMLTDGLLEPDARYRAFGDGIKVYWRDGSLLHDPPHPETVSNRLLSICTFANTEDKTHPVLKAIMLHYAIGQIHPFKDGNGRTARALFYWYLLRHGYDLAQYVSISAILKTARSKYVRSYLYVQTDENDMTYFLLSQLKVYMRAIVNLQHYADRKSREIATASAIVGPHWGFNPRQISILNHALKNRNTPYTIESHKRSHSIAYQSARTDLLELEEKGLLFRKREGRKFVFRAHVDMEERLRTGLSIN